MAYNPTAPLYQQTVQYRTYIKRAVVQGLRSVFENHPDRFIKNTKVTIELPVDKSAYPTILVRFYERYLRNAGVGHHEWIELSDSEGEGTGLYHRFKHFLYAGDVELEALALSSQDRDFLADALVQTIGMADTEPYSEGFLNRIYYPTIAEVPASKTHFLNLKTDDFNGFGDREMIAPWMPEDVLVYTTSYRIGAFGEFYSREIANGTEYGKVEKVELYPYVEDLEAEPNPNPEDPAPWISTNGDSP